jgi:hypothetical protein
MVEKKFLFIRYSEIAKGYVFLGEEMSGSVKEIESRDATFNEDEFQKARFIETCNFMKRQVMMYLAHMLRE